MITKTGYKLFERDKRNGKLYPLFIGKKSETKIDVWLKAEYIPTKGFSNRFGWHLGTVPSAPWLMNINGEYASQRGKNFERVWCLVEYNATIDYTDIASKNKKHDMGDKNPENGYYFFRENNGHIWIISDSIKVVRVLSEKERQTILTHNGVDENKAFQPYFETMMKAKITREKQS